MVLSWLGLELSSLMASTPREVYEVGRDTIIDQISEIRLINRNDAFTEENIGSILNNIVWRGEPVQLTDNGETILDGFVMDGWVDGAFFVMKIQSALKKFFKKIVNYINFDTNPAQAALDILESEEVDFPRDKIDYNSFYEAINIYTNNFVSMGFILDTQYGIALINALNQLKEIGVARVFMDEKLHFDVFQPGETSLYTIEEKDMLTNPKSVQNSVDHVKNDYLLGHLFDASIPATDANGEKLGSVTQGQYGPQPWESLFDENNNYRIGDARTAHFIGGLRMLRDRYLKKKHQFKMRLENQPLFMNKVKNLTFGSYVDKLFRLVRIEKQFNIANCVFEEVT